MSFSSNTPTAAKPKKRLPMFWMVFGGSIVALSLMVFIQPERSAVEPAHLPWNASFDEQGNLHALGLTPNVTTLREAMTLYGKDVEIKLFTDNVDQSQKSAEAYFPVVYIGSIKGALALKLMVSSTELDEAFNRGKKITLTPSGSREVELSNVDTFGFLGKTFSSVTLVPQKHLSDRAITMRFGEPDRVEVQSDNLPHWFYERLGLELIVDQEGPEALQYTPKVK